MRSSNLLQDYKLEILKKKHLHPDPLKQFEGWLEQAIKTSTNSIEPNAMTLATCDKQGRVSARTVILRSFDEKGLVFHTNYESLKAKQVGENPYVAVCFYWHWLERQIRIEGKMSKTSREVSEAYFKSRPYENQIGAWASEQSAIVENREVLEMNFAKLKQKYPSQVPLPDFWGGYCVEPENFEFWQDGLSRLHDRFLYSKQDQEWYITRLCP